VVSARLVVFFLCAGGRVRRRGQPSCVATARLRCASHRRLKPSCVCACECPGICVDSICRMSRMRVCRCICACVCVPNALRFQGLVFLRPCVPKARPCVAKALCSQGHVFPRRGLVFPRPWKGARGIPASGVEKRCGAKGRAVI